VICMRRILHKMLKIMSIVREIITPKHQMSTSKPISEFWA